MKTAPRLAPTHLAALNKYIEPARVTGIFLMPNERRDLAHQIFVAVRDYFSEAKLGEKTVKVARPDQGSI